MITRARRGPAGARISRKDTSLSQYLIAKSSRMHQGKQPMWTDEKGRAGPGAETASERETAQGDRRGPAGGEGKQENVKRVNRLSAPSGTLLKESVCLSISATQLSAYCTVTVSCPPSSFACVLLFSGSSTYCPPSFDSCLELSVQETLVHSHPAPPSSIPPLSPPSYVVRPEPVTWPGATSAIYPLGTQ